MSYPKRGAPKVAISVPIAVFSQFRAVVRRSGVVKDIKRILSENKGKGGATSKVDIELVLTAVMCQIYVKGEITVRHIDMVFEGMRTKHLRKFELLSDNGNVIITEDMIEHFFNKLSHKLRWTNTKEPLTEIEIAGRKARLQDIVNKIIIASLPNNLAFSGKVAVDGMGFHTYAAYKGERIDGSNGNDPDAGTGYRTPAALNQSSFFYGYFLEAMVQVPQANEDVPVVCVGARVIPPGGDEAGAVVNMIDDADSFGLRINHLIGDMAYSNFVAESFADKLRERETEAILAVRKEQHGPFLHKDGYVMLDGWPHCPSILERPDLWEIERPYLTPRKSHPNDKPEKKAKDAAHNEAIKRFRERINERYEKYALRYVGKTNAGTPRFSCRANRFEVKCDACPLKDVCETLPVMENPVKNSAKVCNQQTIAVPYNVGLNEDTGVNHQAKIRQSLYFGSAEWCDEFGKRPRVESFFNNLENQLGVTKGFIKTTGIAATSLFMALAIAVQNIKNIWAWQARNPEKVADDCIERPTIKGRKVKVQNDGADAADFDYPGTDEAEPPDIK